MPDHPSRIGRLERKEIDAIFDEGIVMWADRVAPAGGRLLALDSGQLAVLRDAGFRSAVIEADRYPTLAADVPTVDYSGWPIYCRSDTSPELIEAFCEALVTRRESIPWTIGGVHQPPLPLEQMVRESPTTPLDVPLHHRAAEVWRRHGYLTAP
jgi:TRAP-type uncharacterized transport system substrate-binding protein